MQIYHLRILHHYNTRKKRPCQQVFYLYLYKRPYGESSGDKDVKGQKESGGIKWKDFKGHVKDGVKKNYGEFAKTVETGFGNQLGKMVTNPTNAVKIGAAVMMYLGYETVIDKTREQNKKTMRK